MPLLPSSAYSSSTWSSPSSHAPPTRTTTPLLPSPSQTQNFRCQLLIVLRGGRGHHLGRSKWQRSVLVSRIKARRLQESGDDSVRVASENDWEVTAGFVGFDYDSILGQRCESPVGDEVIFIEFKKQRVCGWVEEL